MQQQVFCTVPSQKEANEIAVRISEAGFKQDEWLVSTDASEIERIVRSSSELAYFGKLGLVIGAVVGWQIGYAFLWFSGAVSFYAWGGSLMIPIFAAMGWAGFGAIVGASGAFSRQRVSSNLENHLEQEVAQGRILFTVWPRNAKELNDVLATLYSVGASDIHYTGELAA